MMSLFAILFASAGAFIGCQLWASSPGPTAQAVSMGMGAVAVLFGAAAGAALGRAVKAARSRGQQGRAWLLIVAGTTLAAGVCRGAYMGRLRAQALERVRTDALTPERARQLMAGPAEVVEALAFNRSCPADVLTELAKSPDESVRAGVAENPGTPPAVVDALARDPSESVRRYVAYNPARRK